MAKFSGAIEKETTNFQAVIVTSLSNNHFITESVLEDRIEGIGEVMNITASIRSIVTDNLMKLYGLGESK